MLTKNDPSSGAYRYYNMKKPVCLWDFWFQSTILQIILSEDPVWNWERSAAQDIDWRREKFNIP